MTERDKKLNEIIRLIRENNVSLEELDRCYFDSIRDTIKTIDVPVVETHVSNIFEREYFRSKSLISGVCIGNVSGFGIKSYAIAINSLLLNRELWNNKEQ